MIKFMGMLMIICSGTMLSYLPVCWMKERIRILCAYADTLKRMKEELSIRDLSIPTLLEVLSEEETMHGIFPYMKSYTEEHGIMAFDEGWRAYVVRDDAVFEEVEQKALLSVGETLGRCAIEDQLLEIERGISVLLDGACETRRKVKETMRLCLGTGVSLSIMLVIVLL